ncbi:aspartate aminotransferase [Lachnospiraceae bacterium KM106-2]|nr:aspartate aminotransferase [Lachnospiraceae bacterium KM106-2]
MEIEFSKKLNRFETGIFSLLKEKKEQLLKEGREVYDFSVGTPDFKPKDYVMDAMIKACKDPEKYKYSLTDLDELVESVQNYYRKRFQVSLEKPQIMSLYGSQEGMAHIAYVLCDPGDIVLVPNPGYPVFEIGPMLSGCEVIHYPLYAKNDFVLDFDDIDENVAQRAKMMIVSYPANPVCAVADEAFYEKLIAFAKKYHIVIVHDSAYADITYKDEPCRSFLSYKGAVDVGIEFYSLSKTFDLTGARISFAVGNESIINQFRMVRSQIDYGIFLPVQYAAIAALNGPLEPVRKQCQEYKRRNQALCAGLRQIGWQVPDSKGTMFVWAPLPDGYTNAEQFCLELMERTGVIVVPGTSFGDLGEGYVRFALVSNIESIEKMVLSVVKSGILKEKKNTNFCVDL